MTETTAIMYEDIVRIFNDILLITFCRWGFSTNGCTDGFSRLITMLHCDTDNTASTVLRLFVHACAEYGVPSRLRSEHGGENTKVALFMNLIRGRSSHITGKSVHNECIERLWRDVRNQVTSVFYLEFYSMEDDLAINLDRDNTNDLLALHYVYLPVINQRLDTFRNAWNQHKIRTEKHCSPYQIWLSGMLEHMGSNYTAPREVFSSAQNLEHNLEIGLARFGISPAEVGEVSLPTSVNGQLSDVQKDLINRETENLTSNKEKFLKCRELLSSGIGQ